MESILLWAAYVAFVLAFCSLAASIFIFVKADVPDAIRFLRHKHLKNQAARKAASKRRKSKNGPGASEEPAEAPKRPKRSTEDMIEASEGPAPKEPKQPAVKSTTGTAVIGAKTAADAANLTSFLVDEDDETEHPTTLLAEDDTERPTTLLANADNPTVHLQADRRAGACPCRPEEAVVSHKPDSSVEFESTFRFNIKKKVLSINTEERI